MHYPPGGHTARKNVVRDAKHVRNDPKHDPRSAQADIARRHQTRDRSGTRTTRTHENDGNGRPNKHAKPPPAGIIGQRVLGGQTTQLLPAISAPLQALKRAIDRDLARASLFERECEAGTFLYLCIDGLRKSHGWLSGYGYNSSSHYPTASLMGNYESESGQGLHLLMRRTFFGARRSSPTEESLAMKVVNKPFSLGTIIFDAKNRAAP